MNSSNTHRKFVTLYCDKSMQTEPTQDDSDAEASEYSDFPPCRIGNDPPLLSRAHYSSESVAAPFKSCHPRVATSRIQRQITIISSDEESPQSQRCQQPNKGLGNTNIINTVHATSTVFKLPKKVFLIYYSLHLAILIANINVRVILLLTRSLC
jgi:hypothetical protein